MESDVNIDIGGEGKDDEIYLRPMVELIILTKEGKGEISKRNSVRLALGSFS